MKDANLHKHAAHGMHRVVLKLREKGVPMVPTQIVTMIWNLLLHMAITLIALIVLYGLYIRPILIDNATSTVSEIVESVMWNYLETSNIKTSGAAKQNLNDVADLIQRMLDQEEGKKDKDMSITNYAILTRGTVIAAAVLLCFLCSMLSVWIIAGGKVSHALSETLIINFILLFVVGFIEYLIFTYVASKYSVYSRTELESIVSSEFDRILTE